MAHDAPEGALIELAKCSVKAQRLTWMVTATRIGAGRCPGGRPGSGAFTRRSGDCAEELTVIFPERQPSAVNAPPPKCAI